MKSLKFFPLRRREKACKVISELEKKMRAVYIFPAVFRKEMEQSMKLKRQQIPNAFRGRFFQTACTQTSELLPQTAQFKGRLDVCVSYKYIQSYKVDKSFGRLKTIPASKFKSISHYYTFR